MNKPTNNHLNYHDSYTCPICRHGQISALPLMEAFGCNFCQHIFSVNLEKETLKVVDSQFPITWYWHKNKWKRLDSRGSHLGWGYLVAAIIFVLIPPSLIGIAAYLYPPLPNSPLSWFPTIWTILTLFSHLACLIWLLLEYYQFPVLIFFRSLRRVNWQQN